MEEEANQPAIVDQNQADAPAAPALAAENEAAVPLLMQGRIPLPKQLPVTGNLAQHWREWKQIWTSYEILSNLQVRDNKYRIATFITCIGADALRIYNSLPFANDEDKSEMDKVLAAMEEYCLGETNVIYERFVFNQRAQQEGETFDQFLYGIERASEDVQLRSYARRAGTRQNCGWSQGLQRAETPPTEEEPHSPGMRRHV